jgi:hypothetical protein
LAAGAVLLLCGVALGWTPEGWSGRAQVCAALGPVLLLCLWLPARLGAASGEPPSEARAVERLARAAQGTPEARPASPLHRFAVSLALVNAALIALVLVVSGYPSERVLADSLRLPERLAGPEHPTVRRVAATLGTDEVRLRRTLRHVRQGEIAVLTGQPREHVERLADCYTQPYAGAQAQELVASLQQRAAAKVVQHQFVGAMAKLFTGEEANGEQLEELQEEGRAARRDALEFQRRFRLQFLTERAQEQLHRTQGRDMFRAVMELPSARTQFQSVLDPARKRTSAFGDPLEVFEVDAVHAATSAEVEWLPGGRARATTVTAAGSNLVAYTLVREADGEWRVDAKQRVAKIGLAGEAERAPQRAPG